MVRMQELVCKPHGYRCAGGANAAPEDIQDARRTHPTRAYTCSKLYSHARYSTAQWRRQSSDPSRCATLCCVLCTFGVQAYVDHSIVTVIVENQTALTVWVHPSSPNSTNLALFQRSSPPAHTPAVGGDGGPVHAAFAGPMMASMTVWQMKAISSTIVS